MIVGVPRETTAGERRVALVPDLVPLVAKAGLETHLETEAGAAAGFTDAAYQDKSAQIKPAVLADADIVLKVQPPTLDEIARMKEGATYLGFLQPYSQKAAIAAMAARGMNVFAMELMPRITRAQPMDALSAMSSIAGYKAVLLAASRLPKFFPLMMTAAGTVTPARVFVLGAGVAGLQAIGTARRLGAVVEAYDTRPAVKEQVESLGGRFVELPLETAGAEDKGGYAKAQSEEFYKKQQELLGKTIANADVVITTALVPGKPAPILVTAEQVQKMRPGSVIIDLAAEAGGNCALTEPGQEVVRDGVTIVGFTNLPSTMANHASQMYSRTVFNFLNVLMKDKALQIDTSDDLVRGPLVLHRGEIVHDVVKGIMSIN
jgi:NAD(P) transhydrogenase subunit alpha